MATKITRDIIESSLHCKYKGHLKLTGQQGTTSDYERLLAESRSTVRRRALDKLLDRYAEGEVEWDVALTLPILKKGTAFLVNATFEGEGVALALDGLQRVPGHSQLGDFHYVPVLFSEGQSVRKQQRALLDTCGLLIARLQGRAPGSGVIWHGKECRATRVRLNPDPRKFERLLEELRQMQTAAAPPRLVLNDHCTVCEFRQRCRELAMREDNLSLLRGLGEKEIRSYARKGVLTLTQLAHTFRPRRKGKRVVRKTHHRYHALQALAVRDRRIYVFGTPALPESPVQIYLDIEGVPDEGFVYLIGMLVVEGGAEKQFSFWADAQDEEPEIFERFLAEVSRYDNFCLFCYGGYERTFLKRMRKSARRKGPVDRILDRLVNVLSLVHAHLYFPTYSNGLKDVAGCLGYSWTAPDASGIQSLVWRAQWEVSHADDWKEKLLVYNGEDCRALRKVTELISIIGSRPGSPDVMQLTGEGRPPVASVEELDRLGLIVRRGKIEFFHPDFEFINNCGHFDYQRQRVFVRTGKFRRKSPKKSPNRRNRRLRISQRVRIISHKCPACKGTEVIHWPTGRKATGYSTKSRRAFDLVFTPSGIKRRVIECTTCIHECGECGEVFVPERYQRLAKYFHGLMSWAMHEYVAHRIGCPMLKEMLKDFFGLSVCQQEVNEFKRLMALYYRPCYKRLLAKILAGKVLHIDETEVRLRTGKAYVWVLATAQEAVYLFRPTREGDFLPGLLKDFKGVLVSDFYTAYDAIDCPQQKCLIHLIRDMNQELLNNPFDQELQSITSPFGTLLRSIVETIDRHGLKHRYLRKHQKGVDKYFESITTGVFRSATAESLRARLLKYRNKLFTFIQHDEVPWNNNNSENAIRQFAYYRENNPGRLRVPGLEDYLVLLSLYQTCRYKGISFLKFLLSRERDIEAFCQRPRRRRRLPVIEVYAKGVDRPDFGPTRADAEKEEMSKLQGEWELVERVSPQGVATKYNPDDDSSADAALRLKLVFQGVTVAMDGDWAVPASGLQGHCKLNPKRRPKTIDIMLFDASVPVREWQAQTTLGIYDLSTDSLRLCIRGDDEKKRPSDFDPGPGKWVFSLRRTEHVSSRRPSKRTV